MPTPSTAHQSSANVQAATHARHTTVIFAMVLAIITYIDRVCISQAAPLISQDLGLTKVEMGWAFSVFGWAYAMFEIPGGWLADRLGPRRVLEERRSVMPFEDGWGIGQVGGHRQHGECQCADEDVGRVDLERPSAEAERKRGGATLVGTVAGDQKAQRPAGQEDEQLGGIGEREVPVREPLLVDARNMVDEDRDKRKAAPEIDGVGFTRHATLEARDSAA